MSALRRLWAKFFGKRDGVRAPVSAAPDLGALAARPAPQDAAGWQDEAQALANLGHWEGAIACLDKAIALDPQSGTAWYDKARCLSALGRLEEAVDCYAQALTINPQMASAWFSKGLAEEKLGCIQDAIRSYEQYLAVGLDQDPEQIEYVRHCLRDLRASGEAWAEAFALGDSPFSTPKPQPPPKDSSAGESVTRKRDRLAKQPSARREKARAHGQLPRKGRESRSRSRSPQGSGRIPYLIPIPIGLIFWLIITLIRGCDASDTTRYAPPSQSGNASEISRYFPPPQSSDVFGSLSGSSDFSRGSQAYFLGEYDAAIRHFTAALDSYAPVGEVYNRRALAYHKKGEYEKALQDYEMALQEFEEPLSLDSRPAMVHNNRAITYLALGEYDQAIADLDRAIELQPELGKAYYNRGLVRSSLGDYDLAIADLSQALLYPASDSSSLYSQVLAQMPNSAFGDKLEAEEMERRFFETGVDRPSTLYQRALVYRVQGKLDSALADLDTAIELLSDRLPETAPVPSYTESAPLSEATTAPEEEHRPEDTMVDLPSVYYLRALICAEKGDYDQAIADLDKALEMGLDPDAGQQLRLLLSAWGAQSTTSGDNEPP